MKGLSIVDCRLSIVDCRFPIADLDLWWASDVVLTI